MLKSIGRASLVALCLATVVPSLVALLGAGAPGADLQIRTLSNRAELISGGDALIRVDVPADVAVGSVKVTVNNTDVTNALRADESGHTLTGVVKGLANGSNVVAASTTANSSARLTIVNHPVTGPIFTGPKEQPFICETQNFKLLAGGTLGPSLDTNCSIATRVDYVYRSTAGGDLKPLADPKNPPSDVAQTTTSLGQTVPYIVRIETGTINRAIYEIAMLHNPAREPAPDFATKPTGWNGRLIYTFGGGCSNGWYHQAVTTGGVDDDAKIGKGYAVASSSLNVAGNNCDEVLSAETMMMVKERFIEAYGLPKFTIGYGGSGGSYQQHVIAEAYPGLLDGIMPSSSFPDMTQALATTSTDSRLLDHYFATLATKPYTDEEKRAIIGYVSVANMMEMSKNRASRIAPTEDCPDVLPAALRYDAVKNPKGARCTIYDHDINVLGRDPKTGFARRPLDNVGIQYGLAAVNAGRITKEQFLDLNEKIGGFDIDAVMVPQRTVADLEAIRNAYRSGVVTNGGGGLATIPILEYRNYVDNDPRGNVHLRYHSFSMRARLLKANGQTDNDVMLLAMPGNNLYPVALNQMDRWLTRISEDASSDPQIAKIRRAKPEDLTDACWTTGPNPQKIVEKQVYGSGQCEQLYPSASFPRGVAGAPIAADVMKCQVKQIDKADYKVTFTADEMTRLNKVFAGGVCDWSKPGVGQQVPSPWLTFTSQSASGGANR